MDQQTLPTPSDNDLSVSGVGESGSGVMKASSPEQTMARAEVASIPSATSLEKFQNEVPPPNPGKEGGRHVSIPGMR